MVNIAPIFSILYSFLTVYAVGFPVTVVAPLPPSVDANLSADLEAVADGENAVAESSVLNGVVDTDNKVGCVKGYARVSQLPSCTAAYGLFAKRRSGPV